MEGDSLPAGSGPAPSATEIKAKSIRGLNASFFFLAVTLLLTLGRKVVLARLLLPSDFGLFAFTTVVVVLAGDLSSLHMEDVIVQSRTDPKRMLNTAFTSQLVISIPIFILLLLLSGTISRSLHKPEMTQYLKVTSIVLLAAPFALPKALFLKALNIFKVKLPAAIGLLANTFICIAMAAAGLGIWSLVVGYVLDAVISGFVVWSYAPERPLLQFDRKIFGEIVRFSLPLYFLLLLGRVFWQGDDFIVGLIGDRTQSLAGNAALGFYTLAFYFPHQLERVRAELAGVSFPAFSAVRSDTQRLESAYSAVTRNNAIFMFSFGAVLIPLAHPTILYLLGEKWLPAVRPLQVFTAAAIVRSITANWAEVYKSLGKTRALIWSFIPNPALLVLLGPFITYRYGILGMSLLILCILPVNQPLVVYLTKKALPRVSFTKMLWMPGVVFAIVLAANWALSGLVRTRHSWAVSAVGFYLLYYVLMALFDRKFRVTAAEYVRISLFTK